jgi:hypothetical protein
LITKVGAPPQGWRLSRPRRALVGVLGVYLALQLFLPLRHLLYPGNVSWTEEGHRFAWHMKLRDKESEARFFAADPATGQSGEIDPLDYVTDWQYDEMAGRPDMIVQLAKHIEVRAREDFDLPDLVVTADVMTSLNGREPARLIDDEVDLTEVELTPFESADWIEPLTEPLP